MASSVWSGGIRSVFLREESVSVHQAHDIVVWVRNSALVSRTTWIRKHEDQTATACFGTASSFGDLKNSRTNS